jgi:hypothetical protein
MAKSSAGTFKLAVGKKSGASAGTPFQASLKGAFAATWQGIGLDPNATAKNSPFALSVIVGLDGTSYSGNYTAKLSSKANKGAAFK